MPVSVPTGLLQWHQMEKPFLFYGDLKIKSQVWWHILEILALWRQKLEDPHMFEVILIRTVNIRPAKGTQPRVHRETLSQNKKTEVD